MTLGTLIIWTCVGTPIVYFLIYEINWKFIWEAIKKWISL
jgi:hypothetical protein